MRRRPPAAYVIRTPRDIGDAIGAYTALRVQLVAELGAMTAADEPADEVLREIDQDRAREIRAQLHRVVAVLAMLERRMRSTSGVAPT
jgi:hypothetical protein